VSYNEDRKWSVAIPVSAINTPAREYSPRLTPDGKRLVFKRKGNGHGEARETVDHGGVRGEIARHLEWPRKYLLGVPIDLLPPRPKR